MCSMDFISYDIFEVLGGTGSIPVLQTWVQFPPLPPLKENSMNIYKVFIEKIDMLKEYNFKYDRFTERFSYELDYFNPLIDIFHNGRIDLIDYKKNKYIIDKILKQLLKDNIIEVINEKI